MRSQLTNVKTWWNWPIHRLPRKWLRTHPTVSSPYAKTTSPGVNVVLESSNGKAGGHRYITATALDRGVNIGLTGDILEIYQSIPVWSVGSNAAQNGMYCCPCLREGGLTSTRGKGRMMKVLGPSPPECIYPLSLRPRYC